MVNKIPTDAYPSPKITHLKICLAHVDDNYLDSFKTDIAMYLGDFEVSNRNLDFLNTLSSKEEIEGLLTKLTSRIVLKFNDEDESLNDFIADYIALG